MCARKGIGGVPQARNDTLESRLKNNMRGYPDIGSLKTRNGQFSTTPILMSICSSTFISWVVNVYSSPLLNGVDL